MPEPKRIERRVMNGGGPVVLAVEYRWADEKHSYLEAHYFVDQTEVWRESFETLLHMLALQQGPAL